MMNLSIATRVLMAAAFLWLVSVMAQQSENVAAAKSGQRGRLTPAERAKLPAPQGFSVVLVLGEMQGTGAAENVPPAARKALVDMKDFLPYKSYRLLDTQWTLCCGHSMIATRLRGVDEQDYDLELEFLSIWEVRDLSIHRAFPLTSWVASAALALEMGGER